MTLLWLVIVLLGVAGLVSWWVVGVATAVFLALIAVVDEFS